MSTENESVSPPLNIEKCSLILVDVAGTTTSINFVKETLFPFVVNQAEEFLKTKWEEEPVKECLKLLQEDEKDLELAAAVEKVKKLTEEESSNKGLKSLQGLIYKQGYEKGDLKAHVFDDVPEVFETWAKNRKIAIYSTGSVDSQKLLYTHTIHGDVSAHIHKYFDQSIGVKTEGDSYKAIAKEVEVAAEEIVFITDDVKEATAAKSGGLIAVLIKREGNPELTEEATKGFTVVSSFKDLNLDKAAKRKIEGEAVSDEAPPSKLPKTDSSEEKEVTKPEEKEKVEETESMEVDTPAEKTEAQTEVKSTAEETAKTAEPQKTEDTEMKEETKVETMETEEKKEETVKEITATTEEEKVEETKDTEKVEETTTAETETKSEEAKVEVPTTEEAKERTEIEPEKTEEKTKVASEESTTKEEEKAEELSKTETEERTTKDVEKTEETVEKTETNQDKATEETPKEETKAVEEEKKTEVEVKQTPEEKSEEAKPEEVEEKAVENGGEKVEENGESKTEEKENKSDLANGIENGKEADVAAGESAVDVDAKPEETEVKVKKLEESAESKTVSVEV